MTMRRNPYAYLTFHLISTTDEALWLDVWHSVCRQFVNISIKNIFSSSVLRVQVWRRRKTLFASQNYELLKQMEFPRWQNAKCPKLIKCIPRRTRNQGRPLKKLSYNRGSNGSTPSRDEMIMMYQFLPLILLCECIWKQVDIIRRG
jgi:hypothetical protein